MTVVTSIDSVFNQYHHTDIHTLLLDIRTNALKTLLESVLKLEEKITLKQP